MSKTAKRIYLVENNLTAGNILVQAATASQAINAAIKDLYKVKVATGIEVAELVGKGCAVIIAGEKDTSFPAQTKESIPEDGGADDDMIGGVYRTASALDPDIEPNGD